MDKIDEIILDLINKDTVSGEEIAKKLKISRVAVWKRIKKLEKLGYMVSSTSKGYVLKKSTDLLVPYEIKKLLNTNWLGRNYIFFEETISTNVYAKEHIDKLPHGTVVLAETQISGKGRKGRKWISEKGRGLYFSIVLKENFPLENFLIFSLVFPLSVKTAIERYTSKKIYIKWPNDLYINEKKFAGFLIESEIEGNEINSLIVGVGINVNNRENILKKLEVPATSLYIEEKKELPRKNLLADILESIENCLENLDPERILREVEKNLLWKGKYVYMPEIHLEGTLLGLNKYGGLKIKTEDGVREVYSGDLSLRRK